MNTDHREFFRFDVHIPYAIKGLQEDNPCSQNAAHGIDFANANTDTGEIERQLELLMTQQKYIDNGGVALFAGLREKISLMGWLLEQSQKDKEHISVLDYQAKMARNREIHFPDIDSSAKVFNLLHALFDRVESYLLELSAIVDKKLQQNVFICQKSAKGLFNVSRYMPGLGDAAKKGNWLASVLMLLVAKLNRLEKGLMALKKVNRPLADYANWQTVDVNLAAGGFAVFLTDAYQQGQKVCSMFMLEEDMVFARAECVYQQDAKATELKRTAFKFTQISVEHEAKIIRFLTAQELASRG